MNNLLNVVEAIVFSAGIPIKRSEILEKLPEKVENIDLNNAISALEEKYSGDCGIRFEVFDESVQFSSNSKYGEIVAEVLQPVKEKELSKILMEVLAIIAYQQPITRSEIEDIRGVSPDYALMVLTKLKLIRTDGFKATPGKPILYATTNEFLKKFELHTIDELPDYSEVMHRLVEFGNFNAQSEGLYREVNLADNFADEKTSSQIQQDDEFLAMFKEDKNEFSKDEKFEMFESEDIKLAAADIDEKNADDDEDDDDEEVDDNNDTGEDEEDGDEIGV